MGLDSLPNHMRVFSMARFAYWNKIHLELNLSTVQALNKIILSELRVLPRLSSDSLNTLETYR